MLQVHPLTDDTKVDNGLARVIIGWSAGGRLSELGLFGVVPNTVRQGDVPRASATVDVHHKFGIARGVVARRGQQACVAKHLFDVKYPLAHDQLQTNIGRVAVRNIHAVFPQGSN